MKNLIAICIVLFYYCIANDGDTLEKRQKLISFSESYLGIPHLHKSKKGFDCSGFTKHCYDHIGIEIPPSSKSQFKKGKKINLSEAIEGDIVVFTGSNSKRRKAGHVGIIHHINQDTVFFIHSSSSQGIIINHLLQPYYKKRYLGTVSMFD